MNLPRRSCTAALLLLGLALGPVAAVGMGQATSTAAVRQDTTTTLPGTTTSAPATTTTVPITTTTVPATTTTTSSVTTTTTGPTTTTTKVHPTTTTTLATASSSSTPWGWIILAVAIVLAALLIILLLARSKRQGQEADWQRSVRPVVTAAELARELVLTQNEADDAQRRASVAQQVDDAVAGLERAADTAPDDVSRSMASRSAESLGGLAFAVEADHLMRTGGEHPTGEQLAAADAARRQRTAEFEAAIQELKAAVAPPPRP